jgi:predicted cupin superfamily sugar epimerase
MTEADQIIAKLGLQPHPEGGWYRQTWVGPDLHIGTNTRASGTAILFLLKAGERSHWHRVDADEIWIWNAGAPLLLSLGETVARDIRMGPDVLGEDQAQAVVPAGHWQAARSLGAWSLVTCTVSPGFRFEGFELADPDFDLPRG